MLGLWKGPNEFVNDPNDMRNGRISFELRDDDIEALKAKLQGSIASGNGIGVSTNGASQRVDQSYESWRAKHPCILQNIDSFFSSIQGKRLAIFLDYDGTLTPIVSNPDMALMSEEMRGTVRHLAQLFPTGIISGRGREKVEKFVKLSELYYAGSHGMDIAGPQGDSSEAAVRFQPAASFAPLMDQIYQHLEDRLKSIPGAAVEHNKFCISAHFRNCACDRWREVEKVVEETLAEHPDLKVTNGRKVLEIRPKVDWDKGRALDHLLEVLGLKQKDVVAIYIGDDTTDEDAFKVLRSNQLGLGILVSTKVKPTFAEYTLRDPTEVRKFLQLLVTWGEGDGNGWGQAQNSGGCIGWKPRRQIVEPMAE